MATQNNEWLKQKLLEQEVKKWTSKFRQAEGNTEEWHKVHQAYLKSDVWAEKRKQVLIRANGKCEGDKCGVMVVSNTLLDVHHLTYDRVGGNEKMSDLKALCSSCHKKADRQRDDETDERRRDNYYQSRLRGFAVRKHGEEWLYYHDLQEAEIEFITFLYKKHCEELGLDFNPHFDPDTDWDFLEFWDMVLDGDV